MSDPRRVARQSSVLGEPPFLGKQERRLRSSLGADPIGPVSALLRNLRLIEGAGACELLAGGLVEDCVAGKPSRWWGALAASLRSYRAAIHLTVVRGFPAIDDWSRSGTPGTSDADLAEERTRLGAEYRKWLCDVAGGRAYIAWLSAYVAVAELDGERALRSLDSCWEIVREFVDAGEPACEASVYERLQSAADALAVFLSLPQHPLTDMRRFALLPAPLRTGYGS